MCLWSSHDRDDLKYLLLNSFSSLFFRPLHIISFGIKKTYFMFPLFTSFTMMFKVCFIYFAPNLVFYKHEIHNNDFIKHWLFVKLFVIPNVIY